jgi:RNA polymerase sigma-70 factor (ECF subfamily)
MEEDIRLVERYRSGDNDAIEELVMKYQKQIYAFVYRIISDPEEAKDLTQKTFLKAFNAIGGFRNKASFKTWLYKIAMNTSLSHFKQNRQRGMETELQEALIGSQAGALSLVIEKERMDYIRKALVALPERQRLAIILRAYEGLSCKETAEVMGCSEGAVKAHYHTAVKGLRVLLKEKGYEF